MALPDLHLTHGQFCLGRDVRAQGRLSSGNLILIPGFTDVRALLSLKEPLEIPGLPILRFRRTVARSRGDRFRRCRLHDLRQSEIQGLLWENFRDGELYVLR